MADDNQTAMQKYAREKYEERLTALVGILGTLTSLFFAAWQDSIAGGLFLAALLVFLYLFAGLVIHECTHGKKEE